MKKVLLSSYACYPDFGSEERTGWAYATMLSANGMDVYCLTKPDGESVIEPMLASGQFSNLTVHYVRLPGWVDKFRDSNLIGMYFHYIYWQWAAYRVARTLNQTHNFDLVHHITYGSIQLGSFMYKLRKPFIFGPVGGGQRAPEALKRYFGSYWSREVMRDWVSTLLQYTNPGYYQAVKRADTLIVANQDTFALARRLRPTRSIKLICDMGLYDSFMPPQPIRRISTAGDPLKLLWVGRMLPRKALELTLQALGQVDPALPVILTIVGGKGEMAEYVPGYIEQYGVVNRVNWVGHVSYQEVREFYTNSDAFIFTSLRDTGPHQLLEAMAYSLPIITLDLHGQAELVSDETGIRVPVANEEQVVAGLARAVEWMQAHPAERTKMGQTGYAFAQTHVWDLKIRTFIDELYPAVLQAAVPPSVHRANTEIGQV